MSDSKVIDIKKANKGLGFKFVDLVAAAKNPKRHIEMLIKGCKLGTIVILAGDGGIGKSTFLLGVSYGLAHPELDVFNLSVSTKPRKVMVLSAEDDEDIVSNKMHDFDKLHQLDDRKRALAAAGVFITTEKDLMEKITDEVWMDKLKYEIDRLGIDLVVFDTYSVFGGVENENDNAEAARIVTILNRKLIAKSDLCVLLVHHTNGEGDIRGAKSLRMNTRATYVIRRPNDDEAKSMQSHGFNPDSYANFEIIKSNYAPRGSLCWLEMTETGVFKLADSDVVDAATKGVVEASKKASAGARYPGKDSKNIRGKRNDQEI